MLPMFTLLVFCFSPKKMPPQMVMSSENKFPILAVGDASLELVISMSLLKFTDLFTTSELHSLHIILLEWGGDGGAEFISFTWNATIISPGCYFGWQSIHSGSGCWGVCHFPWFPHTPLGAPVLIGGLQGRHVGAGYAQGFMGSSKDSSRDPMLTHTHTYTPSLPIVVIIYNT